MIGAIIGDIVGSRYERRNHISLKILSCSIITVDLQMIV